MSTGGLRRLGVLLCILACSNDDGAAGACTPVEPCGGDILGLWQVESLCFAREQAAQAFESGLPAECAGAFSSADAVVQDATLDYGADGTLTTTGTAQVHASYSFSLACLRSFLPDLSASSLSGMFCASIVGRVWSSLDRLEPVEGITSCSSSGSACDCETSALADLASSVSYTTSDDQLVIGARSAPYCVSGDRLEQGNATLGGTAVARRL